MDHFLSWDVLLTFSGCVAGTILLTEFIKMLWPGVFPQLCSFIVAVLILVVGHLATSSFAWPEAPLYLVNAVAVSLSANGGFDAIEIAFGKKEEKPPTQPFDEWGN